MGLIHFQFSLLFLFVLLQLGNAKRKTNCIFQQGLELEDKQAENIPAIKDAV